MRLAQVDVLIVTHQSADHLAACVGAVRAWGDVASVTVVDNCSTDASVAVAKMVADTVVEMPLNVGFGAGQNVGAAQGSAPYLLLLNPDAIVDVDALQAGLAYLRSNDDVAAVQGEVRRSSDCGLERSSGREPGLLDLVSRLLQLKRLLGDERLQQAARAVGARYFSDRDIASPSDVEFLAAVAPLVRRGAFEQVGGFDERFFLYAEDIDLGRRLRQAGWFLRALPSQWATHIGGASSAGARPSQRRRWWDAHSLFIRLHWRGPRRAAGIVLVAVGRSLARGGA